MTPGTARAIAVDWATAATVLGVAAATGTSDCVGVEAMSTLACMDRRARAVTGASDSPAADFWTARCTVPPDGVRSAGERRAAAPSFAPREDPFEVRVDAPWSGRAELADCDAELPVESDERSAWAFPAVTIATARPIPSAAVRRCARPMHSAHPDSSNFDVSDPTNGVFRRRRGNLPPLDAGIFTRSPSIDGLVSGGRRRSVYQSYLFTGENNSNWIDAKMRRSDSGAPSACLHVPRRRGISDESAAEAGKLGPPVEGGCAHLTRPQGSGRPQLHQAHLPIGASRQTSSSAMELRPSRLPNRALEGRARGRCAPKK